MKLEFIRLPIWLFAIIVLWFFSVPAFAQAVSESALELHSSPSLLSLFWQASFVVKLVMIGLLLSSIWCWAIIADKLVLLSRVRRLIRGFETSFWSGQSLEALYNEITHSESGRSSMDISCPMSALFVAAMGEWKRSLERNAGSPHGLRSRIDKALEVSLNRQMERLEVRLLYLASLGSAAPFVGLFGTVIGIMGSFQAIAGSKSTNLSVVAPGIAEALLATALGLLAAIPAVVAYNKFSSDFGKIGVQLEGFADEFSSILSRRYDEQTASG